MTGAIIGHKSVGGEASTVPMPEEIVRGSGISLWEQFERKGAERRMKPEDLPLMTGTLIAEKSEGATRRQ